MNITLIENKDRLTSFLESVRNRQIKTVAADFEGESNLHRYGIHLCLIQFSINDENVIIDPVAIPEIDSIKNMLEDQEIQKVMFCAEFDVKLLKYTRGIRIRNIYDVQAGFKLLGYEKLGLENIAAEVLGIDKSLLIKKQKSDWNKRPLEKEQLDYAVNDVKYLFEMKRYLENKLNSAQKRELKSINLQLEDCEFTQKKYPYLSIKGSGNLTSSEKVYLKHLYSAREKVAQKIDFPAYWVVDNKAMLNLARIKKFDKDYFRKKIKFPRRAEPMINLFEEAFLKGDEELGHKNISSEK